RWPRVNQRDRKMAENGRRQGASTRRQFALGTAAAGALGMAGFGSGPALARVPARSLRDSPFPVLMRLVNHNPNAIYQPLESAADLVTWGMYISPNAHSTTINGSRHFDHSDAGIELAAANVANLVATYTRRRGTSIAMFDVEGYRSINVPLEAGYDPLVDRDRAARYDPFKPEALRKEAIRYHTRLIGRTGELLATRTPNFEPGEYNVAPSIYFSAVAKPGRPEAFGAKLAADVAPGLLPLLGFTGPDCRLNLNQNMSDRIASAANSNLHITPQQLIYWAATGVATARAALGAGATIIPSIWPRFWAPSSVRLPHGSAALPQLFMRDYCNAILDAGANGFSCWTPGSDQALGASDQQAMLSSWQEVVGVIRARRAKV
ncbi:MAG: hypothetical protein ACJ8H8_17285, partial [Geminicoccaceae bacterium]